MQRYFCNKLDDNKFTLSSDDSFHIEKVMRMKLGEKIEVVYNNETYKLNYFLFIRDKLLLFQLLKVPS